MYSSARDAGDVLCSLATTSRSISVMIVSVIKIRLSLLTIGPSACTLVKLYILNRAQRAYTRPALFSEYWLLFEAIIVSKA